MTEPTLRTREDVLAMLNILIESRVTPGFLVHVSKPGNLDWLHGMVEAAFNRIEGKSSVARSRSLG